MTPWNHHHYNDGLVESFVPQTMVWSAAEEHGGEQIRFLTTAETTGETLAHIPAGAMRRMVCLYIVTHLVGKHLTEAHDALLDIYRWQLKEPLVASVPQKTRSIPATGLKSIERAPFVYPDE